MRPFLNLPADNEGERGENKTGEYFPECNINELINKNTTQFKYDVHVSKQYCIIIKGEKRTRVCILFTYMNQNQDMCYVYTVCVLYS